MRLYLSVFAFIMPDYRDARREHSLIAASVEEYAAELAAAGTGQTRAHLISMWRHLGELQPVTLALKTLDDAATASPHSGSRRWYAFRLVVVAGFASLLVTLAFTPSARQVVTSVLLVFALFTALVAAGLSILFLVDAVARGTVPWRIRLLYGGWLILLLVSVYLFGARGLPVAVAAITLLAIGPHRLVRTAMRLAGHWRR